MRLPFKTRRQLKAEIEHLTEQLRILGNERQIDAANYRREITELEDKCKFLAEKSATLASRLEELLEAEQTINRLRKELNEMKDLNAGLGSTVSELKQRNYNLARKIAKMEEKSNIYEAKRQKP